MLTILEGDCKEVLKTIPENSIHCVITSPPYFKQRDYKAKGQLGLEKTPELYISALLEIFKDIKRVLRKDGTCWLILGDTYIKKQLSGIPWRIALALKENGWYLRSDVIWAKNNPMPQNVNDRPGNAHEYIFLLTKSSKYFFDAEAIKVPSARPGDVQTFGGQKGRDYVPEVDDPNYRRGTDQWGKTITVGEKRHKRDVWTVANQPYKGAHFAVFPEKLIEPCVLGGCPVGGTVLDPFGGSGTTAKVALKHGRNAMLIELNPEYRELINQRVKGLIEE